jgi:hypothetical protein
MKSAVAFVIFFCSFFIGHSQEVKGRKGFMVYTDTYGDHRDCTVNAGYFFWQWRDFNFYGYTGFWAIKKLDNQSFYNNKHLFWQVPAGLGFVKGNRRSHLEGSVGLSYQDGRIKFGNLTYKTIYFLPWIGYRFQKPSGKFFFRLLYTPLFQAKEFSKADPRSSFGKSETKRIGLTIGYYFGK